MRQRRCELLRLRIKDLATHTRSMCNLTDHTHIYSVPAVRSYLRNQTLPKTIKAKTEMKVNTHMTGSSTDPTSQNKFKSKGKNKNNQAILNSDAKGRANVSVFYVQVLQWQFDLVQIEMRKVMENRKRN